jgi:FkbM family methyltransferase
MKTILIAIPTNKYIEPETMKAIYDLEVPEGYKTTFQFFYGYQIDQIRNLIANWAANFDYLFSVDSDITFKSDTLKKMLSYNKDMVSGLYIQRKPGEHILELYRNGMNIPYNDIKGKGLIEVDGCGFGCVLVNSNVIRSMEYPHFVYKSAIDHRNTLSEDNYFCNKAKILGFKIFADTSILCEHIGNTKFIVDPEPPAINQSFSKLLELSNHRLLPRQHLDYLFNMQRKRKFEPKVVYDIGACVLHWTREAVNVWPQSKFIAFEAMPECSEIFKHYNVPHYIGVLSDKDGKQVTFHQNTEHPGGNSIYKENEKYANNQPVREEKVYITRTLDSVVAEYNLELPNLIKMDVQGSELDILKGAKKTLKTCTDLILELQHVEYNKGAPLKDSVIDYLEKQGFKLISGPFSNNGPDGDYHFSKV